MIATTESGFSTCSYRIYIYDGTHAIEGRISSINAHRLFPFWRRSSIAWKQFSFSACQSDIELDVYKRQAQTRFTLHTIALCVIFAELKYRLAARTMTGVLSKTTRTRIILGCICGVRMRTKPKRLLQFMSPISRRMKTLNPTPVRYATSWNPGSRKAPTLSGCTTNTSGLATLWHAPLAAMPTEMIKKPEVIVVTLFNGDVRCV